MDEQPKRRWFRFRLSTVLILTAIVAWAMACRPSVDWGYLENTVEFDPTKAADLYIALDDDPKRPGDSVVDFDNVCFGFSLSGPSGWNQRWISIAPKSLVYPAISLAAFLAWKAAWAVIERRRARRITAPPLS